MARVIYADNAATTPMDEDALILMTEIQRRHFANPSSAYGLARPLKKILNDSREKIAACINAAPSEIFFTSGGTESNNWAIKSGALSKISPHLITSAVEHKSVLNSCRAVAKYFSGAVTELPVDKTCAINPENLRAEIRSETAVVSVMLANNEVGTIQPVKKLAEISHQYGKFFHTDAVQAVGHIPVDVKNLGVDALSASAHKFNGPKGVGFLFVKSGAAILPWHEGGGQEFNLRAGTENVPAIAAMALALEKNCAALNDTANKNSTIARQLVERLNEAEVDFLSNGGDNRLPGHLSLSFKNCDGETLLHRLDLKKICVSTGSACNSRRNVVSHVLSAMKIPRAYIRGTIRITFGRENFLEDAAEISNALLDILKSPH